MSTKHMIFMAIDDGVEDLVKSHMQDSSTTKDLVSIKEEDPTSEKDDPCSEIESFSSNEVHALTKS